jgi:hypothetical protein
MRTESTAVNERRRIVKLWQQHDHSKEEGGGGVSVFSFADLSVVSTSSCCLDGDNDNDDDEEEEDDFDVFHYKSMTIADRSRCALMRAAQMLLCEVVKCDSNHCGDWQVILLSEDEFHLQRDDDTNGSLRDNIIRAMNCDTFLLFWMDSIGLCAKTDEHWKKVKQNCIDDYDKRNKVSKMDESGGNKLMDPYGHFEYSSDEDLEQGLKTQKLFRSVMNVSDDNPKEAYCIVRHSNGTDTKYYLNELHGHFNRSIHGDVVVIEPLSRDQWEEPVGKRQLVHIATSDNDDDDDDAHVLAAARDANQTRQDVIPTARVVGIHKTNPKRRQFVASMIPYDGMLSSDQNYILVVPMDYKIPRIRIKTRIAHDKLENKRLLVEIDGWDVSSMNPHGHLVQVLGDVGDLNTEVGCLLRERGIDLSPFSANALACLPSVNQGGGGWDIDADEIRKRRDLRKTCRIFSVDPEGCQDIDDAMHAKGEVE